MKTFLSSTFIDLIDHRQSAAEAMKRLGQHVGRMEVFGARPEEPMAASLNEIDACDVFVGVYAHRYGYIPDGTTVSITEAEFDYAIRHSKPAFCFFIDQDHPWPPKMIEDGEAKKKLTIFKNKVGSGLVRDTFTTREDLAYKVAAALGRYLVNQIPPTPSPKPNSYFATLQSAGDLVSLLESCLIEIEDVTRTDYNQIFLITTGAYEKNLLAVADALPNHKQRYRKATFAGLLGSVAASGKTLNAAKVRERPGYFQAVLETRSELVVPIGTGTAVLGVINSESENEDHYNSEVVQRLQMLADALSQLLPAFGWMPSTKANDAPWIKREPRHENG